jgi:hypothetical protein
VRYGVEWIPGTVLLLAVVVLPLVPAFALIGLVVVVLAAVAAVAALAAAILATPYLLVRSVHRRLAERHRSTGGSGPVATAIARATTATTTANRAESHPSHFRRRTSAGVAVKRRPAVPSKPWWNR